jgi:3-oxoacyl-ACP reductase-like protein
MMGLFKNMMDRIFHGAGVAEAPADALRPGQSNESRVAAAQRQGVPVAQATPGAATAAAPAAAAPAATITEIDVAASLEKMAATNPEKLDWKHSIVDLMKLVGMESSLQERKELADELGYTGDKNDSAKMNMWLHKEVMKRMEQNGGKVPANLKD